jgi:hypothetical protein
MCLCVALATMTYHASALGSVTIAGHQVKALETASAA